MKSSHHLFTYEQKIMQKLSQQGPPEEFNDSSNQKLDSASIGLFQYLINQQVFQQKSLLREVNTLIYRQREDFVSYDEFYQFLRRMYICEDPDQCLKLFRKLAGHEELFDLQDFNSFLSQDILKLDYSMMSQCELILRIGLEIFDNLSDQNNELDLKQTVYFIKEDLHEDIDFIEVIDLFGFVQDIYSGQLTTKIALSSFFQKISPQLRKALSNIMLKRIQQVVGFKRVQFHKRQKNQLFKNEKVKTDIQKLLQKNFQINFDVEVEEKQQKNSDSQEQIVNLIQSNKPKIRGWLQRHSITKSGKWQLLFFQIDQSTRILKAAKPEGIKKIHHLMSCQFICLQEIVTLPHQGCHHRKTNSLHSHHNDKDEQMRPVHTENNATHLCPYSNAFLIQESQNSKVTLIKSWDIREIEQVFYEMKQDIDQELNYSGIIDLCVIQNEPLDKIRNKFKNFQFKEHLLVIKDGKIIIYGAIIKHTIDLSKTRVTPYKDLPFIPSHPFPFQLAIDESQQKSTQPQYIKVQKRIENQDDQNSVIMFQIEEDENENSDKEDQKKGFFDSLYDKFKKKSVIKKKEIKLVLAAESEPKRRQWIFSINYYKSNPTDLGELVKYSNRSSFQTPMQSQPNYTPKQSYIRSNNNTQMYNVQHNQNVYIGGNHTQINVGIFNIGADDDFYDVFKADKDGQKRQSNQSQAIMLKQHCHTDPNEYQQKECKKFIVNAQLERLITQPSNGGQVSSKQIYSTSSVELWQKFLFAFFQYLVKQKNLSVEEAQEPKIQTLYSRPLKICKQK